jgi:quercetin dioxygenase-like cupin family protein
LPVHATIRTDIDDRWNAVEKFSLDAIAREQSRKAAGSKSGRSAETVYGGHEHVLRQTVIALTAGSSMAEHESPGEATLLVIGGRVRMTGGENSWEGRDGDLLVIPPSRHSLEALTDATVLLTVAKRR